MVLNSTSDSSSASWESTRSHDQPFFVIQYGFEFFDLPGFDHHWTVTWTFRRDWRSKPRERIARVGGLSTNIEDRATPLTWFSAIQRLI